MTTNSGKTNIADILVEAVNALVTQVIEKKLDEALSCLKLDADNIEGLDDEIESAVEKEVEHVVEKQVEHALDADSVRGLEEEIDQRVGHAVEQAMNDRQIDANDIDGLDEAIDAKLEAAMTTKLQEMVGTMLANIVKKLFSAQDRFQG